jgi:hypothetical protein
MFNNIPEFDNTILIKGLKMTRAGYFLYINLSKMEQVTKKQKVLGKVRVGRLNWDYTKKRDSFVTIPGYKTIIIKNYKSGLGASLSPYFLKNEKGQLHESIWQVCQHILLILIF